jgi:hypothetical protein
MAVTMLMRKNGQAPHLPDHRADAQGDRDADQGEHEGQQPGDQRAEDQQQDHQRGGEADLELPSLQVALRDRDEVAAHRRRAGDADLERRVCIGALDGLEQRLDRCLQLLVVDERDGQQGRPAVRGRERGIAGGPEGRDRRGLSGGGQVGGQLGHEALEGRVLHGHVLGADDDDLAPCADQVGHAFVEQLPADQ